MMSNLHDFYLEHFCDKLLTLELISLCHKLLSKSVGNDSISLCKVIMQLEPPILDGDKFNKLLHAIDDAFRHAIERTCSSF